jgi:hypothetical protein
MTWAKPLNMASEKQQTSRRSISELLGSFKAKKKERRRDEAARNIMAADQHWEVLSLTGGSARRGNHFVAEYRPNPEQRESGCGGMTGRGEVAGC